MTNSLHLIDRLTQVVRSHNRELAFDAGLKAFLGIVFSCITFGLLFWLGWFVGLFFASYLHLDAWQFGLILTGLFLVVATWSAWRRVDPLAGLQPLSDAQLLLTLISQASGSLLYFSPRHSTAGAAMLLLGGPANVLEAFGIWAHRIRFNPSLIQEASHLLEACQTPVGAEQVSDPAAAWLLKHLAFIDFIPNGDSAQLVLTEKGLSFLHGGKMRKGKRATKKRK
jgi:hypothetical protein